MWLEQPVKERSIIKKKKERKGKSFEKIFFFFFKEKKERVLGEGLTIVRSLFKPKNTSCFLIDLRSAMSEGSSSACSIASAT